MSLDIEQFVLEVEDFNIFQVTKRVFSEIPHSFCCNWDIM